FAIVFLSPCRDLHPSIGQIVKQVGVQTLIAQPAVETLHVAVLHRPSRLNMNQLDLPLFAPAQEMPTGQLGPVVATNSLRVSSTVDDRFQSARHSTARQTCVHF